MNTNSSEESFVLKMEAAGSSKMLEAIYEISGVTSQKTLVLRSNKMQQYAGIYLLQNHSTCFRCPSHPSSGVRKTVTAAAGTGHSI